MEVITNTIRLVQREDLDELKHLVDASGLFPSRFLHGLIRDYISNPKSRDYWFTMEDEGKLIAMGCVFYEKMTDNTYVLHGLAVHPDHEQKGHGKRMLNHIEDFLREKGARLLLVETTSDFEFDLRKDLYQKLDYHIECHIKNYWKDGIDKVIFKKRLDV